jgi:hydrogenase maturation protein HypF
MSKRCKKITIRGIVQGMGFRPFVYGLAIKHALKGSVENTGSGVVVIAQGNVDALEAPIQILRETLRDGISNV